MTDNEIAHKILQILCISKSDVFETDSIANAILIQLSEINRIVKLMEQNGDIKTYKDKDTSSKGAIGIFKIIETQDAFDSGKYLPIPVPKFNVYIKTNLFIYNILEISNDNLNTIVEAFSLGRESFTISGEKYWISEIQTIKIFKAEIDINDSYTRNKGTRAGLLERDTMRRVWMSIEFLKLFGADITEKVLGDLEYGSKSIKNVVKNEIEYISESRFLELKAITSKDFDLKRLIQLCEELNDNFNRENYLSVIMVIRTIINHIPPIFGKSSFNEIASNVSGESKSFKRSMENLNNRMKHIADRNLHQPIRQSETLPNSVQVDFRQDLDVLLEEVVRVLK